MRTDDTILILRYLGKIPSMIEELHHEMDRMEEMYNPIKAIPLSDMPKGTAKSDSTATLGEKMAMRNKGRRLAECRVTLTVLQTDESALRGLLDRMDYRYKILLEGRYIFDGKHPRENWRKLACKTHWSEATARRKERFALTRLGEMLDGIPMIDEVLARALDARD